MAKTLPPYGDIYLGDNPWAVRQDEVIMYLTGRNTSAVVYGTDVDSDDVCITNTSAALTSDSVETLFTVPAGCFVRKLYACITDTWGADSTVIELTIGDTATADLYFTDTLFGPATSSVPSIMRTNNGTAGRFYDTGATIGVTFVTATTDITTGLTKFVLVYSMAR